MRSTLLCRPSRPPPLTLGRLPSSRPRPLALRAASSSGKQQEATQRSQDLPAEQRPASPPATNGASQPAVAAAAQPPSELLFLDEEGRAIPVMPADYGFRSGTGRLYQEKYGSIPGGGWSLGVANFKKELRALRRSVRYDKCAEMRDAAGEAGPLRRAAFAAGGAVRRALEKLDVWLEDKEVLAKLPGPKDARLDALTPEQRSVLDQLRQLKLDDGKVAAREKRREAAGQLAKVSWPIKFVYVSLCWVLDVIYAGRPIQRFWVLEEVARMPYFVYISMLHLYESLGWWRAGAELRKVHFAEEWNELHHLQIMEALGGDLLWADRFVAQHAALFYYWLLVLVYLVTPRQSYAFMELIEGHATDTYTEFAEQNKELLATMPPPLVALNYYKSGDLYLFDEFQTSFKGREPRRPACNNLHDVFVAIRDDEIEHVKTMQACQNNTISLDMDREQLMRREAGRLHIGRLPLSSSEEEEEREPPA